MRRLRITFSRAHRLTFPAAGWTDDDLYSSILIALSIVFAISPFGVAVADPEFLPYAPGVACVFALVIAIGLLAWGFDRFSRSLNAAI